MTQSDPVHRSAAQDRAAHDGAAHRDAAASTYGDATRAAVVGLLINLALGVIKLVGGVLGHSFALVSDAVNSLGDAVGTVVVIFALRVAQRPPDDEHPYGHSRAEALAGSYVALLMTVSAMFVAHEAWRQLSLEQTLPHVWTLWLAGANVVVKEALYRYKSAVGRRTKSSALLANAWDHRSDALCSLAVLCGLSLAVFLGPTWSAADEIASLVVAAFIALTGIRLVRQSASELMDLQADDELVREIRAVAAAVPQVKQVEKLHVRKSGLEYFVDIHVNVDPQLTVEVGHRIGHDVKDSLRQKWPMLRDVLVHLEPYHPEAEVAGD
jgi:cation diffusion facilitator family transporter